VRNHSAKGISPVDDTMFMAISDGRKELFHDFSSITFRETIILDDTLKEFTAFQVLGNDIILVLIFVHFVHLEDIRVILEYIMRYFQPKAITKVVKSWTSVISLECSSVLIASLQRILAALVNPDFL